MTPSDPDATPKRNPLSRWFWGGFFAILLLGLIVSVFAVIRGGGSWIQDRLTETRVPPLWKEAIRVTLTPGESVYLDATALAKARAQVLKEVRQRRREVEARLTEAMDLELDRIFAQTDARVPVFADWYYSLTGEYTRLFNAAFGDLPGFLSERLDKLVFGPAGTAQAIDALSVGLGEESAAQVADTLGMIRDLLVELVRESALPEESVRVTGEWDLGGRLTAQLGPYVGLTSEDIARQGVATTAGAAAAAAMAAKLGGTAVAKAAGKLAAKPSVGAVSALAAKLGLKSAVKAGGTLGATGSGAAAGAALCVGTVAGAPLSPGCALVGGAVSGVAAWLLVDKAVIEADEYLNRETFETGLREALAEERAALRQALERRYLDGARAVLDQLGAELGEKLAPRPIAPKKDFVPARAAPAVVH